METTIFERAARKKLRFTTPKGMVSVEDLWDMPLQSKSGYDLDSTARAVNAKLKDAESESFVDTTTNPAKDGLQLQMDVVLRVIAVLKQERADAAAKETRRAERARIIEVLAGKQDEKLRGMSAEQLMAQLDALDKAGT